jgi:DNA-directed RNA polymerase III subunit RPC1
MEEEALEAEPTIHTAQFMIKEFVSEKSDQVKKLSKIEFSVLSAQDAKKLSHAEIASKQLYIPNTASPQPAGPLDPRLGSVQKKSICSTCAKSLQDCSGHFGHVSLIAPVFHVGFVKHIQVILQIICKTCSRVLLDPAVRESCAKQMNRLTDSLRKNAFYKGILAKCKRIKKCFYCGAINGVVKKLKGAMRLVHVPYDDTKSGQFDRDKYFGQFSEAAKQNKEMVPFVSGAVQDLTPLVVYRLFENIPESDYLVLNLGKSKPQDMLATRIPVPPVCIRPSVPVAGGSGGTNEDDLTVKISDIIFINNFMKNMIEGGSAPMHFVENSEFLQQQVAMYINSDLPGFPKTLNLKRIRALTQRLKGKQGRFRGNLSGKRVDFSGRTVISPDPNLQIDQVGIPVWTAKRMTFPERVTSFNMTKLKAAILNGPDVHPGANFVERKGFKRSLKFVDRKLVAKQLQVGDIVERHMCDDDAVLFNRQPSLHRVSIMCHRAKILPWRTHRFNVSVCEPYNADFDGDEMNLHLPQTHEARAEAAELMAVHKNLLTPRHGAPLVGPNQDFLTACYLITNKDVFYDRSQFCHICCYFNGALENIILPPPSIMKPVQLWTGKQIFGVLLRPNEDLKWPLLNVEAKEKWYEQNGYLDTRDGFVCIRKSNLLCGALGKVSLKGSKSGVIYSLIKYHDSVTSASVMSRIARLCGRWLANRGFSIGIDDVTPSLRLSQLKRKLLDSGYDTCESSIREFEFGKLKPQPGCNEEETLESIMLGTLSRLRDEAGNICLRELPYLYNSPLIMALCGSKGSPLNISQMIACAGQQSVNGTRIPNGFVDRTLPHFHRHSKTPAARGFVENSFFTGLCGTEFFFHTMGGREGLVDTAVKTAETGYMQRRLVKALEDLCCLYDGSVRNSENNVVQFQYGDDGLDPIMLEGKGPIDLLKLFRCVLSWNSIEQDVPLLPDQIIECAKSELSNLAAELPENYVNEMISVLTKESAKLESCIENINLNNDMDDSEKRLVMDSVLCVSERQLKLYIHACHEHYLRARIEPGTAVGAIAAQSIGEPGTQMTLKTFHFAGVAR